MQINRRGHRTNPAIGWDQPLRTYIRESLPAGALHPEATVHYACDISGAPSVGVGQLAHEEQVHPAALLFC